jgi:hypothetical protein
VPDGDLLDPEPQTPKRKQVFLAHHHPWHFLDATTNRVHRLWWTSSLHTLTLRHGTSPGHSRVLVSWTVGIPISIWTRGSDSHVHTDPWESGLPSQCWQVLAASTHIIYPRDSHCLSHTLQDNLNII